MRKKSTYIVLIAILLVFFVIMFLIFGVKTLREEKRKTILLVGDHTVWSYANQKWKNIVSDASIQELNWDVYSIYLNREKFGDYYLWHDDQWYAFDEHKNAVLLEGDFLAYSSNYDISVANFTEEEIADTTYISSVLQEHDLSVSSKFTSSYQIRFDFDSDGEEETFYLISNAFPMDFEPEAIFSIVFMVKNQTIYPIYTDVSKNLSFNGCKPFFTSFLDVNTDSTYELVLSCGRYSVAEQIDMLYQFDGEAFKIVISNQ